MRLINNHNFTLGEASCAEEPCGWFLGGFCWCFVVVAVGFLGALLHVLRVASTVESVHFPKRCECSEDFEFALCHLLIPMGFHVTFLTPEPFVLQWG